MVKAVIHPAPWARETTGQPHSQPAMEQEAGKDFQSCCLGAELLHRQEAWQGGRAPTAATNKALP